ncbi:hypothetical protein LJB93_01365 [Desulfovibrio sp. OttesenSCG-928-F07]|nr:hypothetical protein [Desulfovibrio sp. OttesenSCG-928-F07]
MNNKPHTDSTMLSLPATGWFYVALVLVCLFYAFLTCFSTYGMLYEPQKEFFVHLMVVLAAVTGLSAAILTFKRNIYGPVVALVPCLIIGIGCVSAGSNVVRTDDILPFIILFGAPMLMLLSQIPTLKKLKALGPGWGLGSMAYSNTNAPVSRGLVWWYRITLVISLLIYAGLLIGFCGIFVNDPPRVKYSLYIMGLASINGLYAVFMLYKKEKYGVFLGLVPCLLLLLGGIDIGFGYPLKDFTLMMLPFAVIAEVLMLSQLPYLKKLNTFYMASASQGGSNMAGNVKSKVFTKAHFVNGSTFAEQDIAELYRTWKAYGMSVLVFQVPSLVVALILGQILAKSVGGVIGNFGAVALIFMSLIFSAIMSIARKKRYTACRNKLGLTEQDVRQALAHMKKGTVANTTAD